MLHRVVWVKHGMFLFADDGLEFLPAVVGPLLTTDASVSNVSLWDWCTSELGQAACWSVLGLDWLEVPRRYVPSQFTGGQGGQGFRSAASLASQRQQGGTQAGQEIVWDFLGGSVAGLSGFVPGWHGSPLQAVAQTAGRD